VNYQSEVLQQLNTENHSSLVSLLEQVFQEHGKKMAYSCLGHEIDYAEFDRLSQKFGAYLNQHCGLSKGDRIAIQLPNITQYPIAVWGALRAGLVVVNTNPMYTAREQLHQFNDSGAVVLVALQELLPTTLSILDQTKINRVLVTGVMELVDSSSVSVQSLESADVDFVSFSQALKEGGEASIEDPKLSMSDLAVLQYTGGTTGPSKGAMLSHGNLFSGMTMSRKSIIINQPGDPEIQIVPLPLYHVFGFTSSTIGSVLHGGTSVLIPNARDLDSIIDAMKAYPFTYMASVNTLLQGLLAHPEFDNVDFSHLRAVIAGGTTLVKEIAEEWGERTNTQILEGYGLSETSSTATCNRFENQELGTVGPALEHAEIKLVNSDGNTVADGEAGEVCIRGPHIMQGYWNKPDATAESIDADGWFKTGDIAVMREGGRLKIVDRIKDMIIVSGFNVYPNEVEAVIYGHPNVTECAAIGVPDEASGEAIKLFVVSNDQSLSSEDIINFCRNELTAYKVPKQIIFADDLPKSPAGKILRRELREL